MSVELTLVGAGCFALALGHTTIGLRWVLPDLTNTPLRATPFGPPSLTLSMLRFTWNVVSLMLVAFGVLFLVLAADQDADPKTLLLRWFAALWLVATALACWDVRHRPRSLLRFPVPLLFLLVAMLSWIAST